MRTYLLCMKNGVSSVDEKKTRNDNNKLRRFILQLWGVGKNYKAAQNFRVSVN